MASVPPTTLVPTVPAELGTASLAALVTTGSAYGGSFVLIQALWITCLTAGKIVIKDPCRGGTDEHKIALS